MNDLSLNLRIVLFLNANSFIDNTSGVSLEEESVECLSHRFEFIIV